MLDDKLKPVLTRLEKIENSMDEKLNPVVKKIENSIDEKLNPVVEKIQKSIDDKLNPVLERLGKMENSLKYALDELQDVTNLGEAVSNQNKELLHVKSEMDKLSKENQALKERIIKQENYSRRNNLRVVGIISSPGASLEQTLIENLAKAGITLTLADIERAHYTNQRTQKGVILVRFSSWSQRDMVMKSKSKLLQQGIRVQEDFPIEIVERRRLLLPIFYKAKDLYPQMNPKLQLDKIILGGKIYTQDNIHTIPHSELHPQSVFTPCQHGIQAFYTKYSPLSNHYPCKFHLDGKTFSSAEQCLMYKKAMLFDDQHTADRILQTHDPAAVKSLGKSVSGFNKDIWIKNGPDCMFHAMTAKFSQNDKLKAFLKGTGKNLLVEASPNDKFWGSGVPLRSKDTFNKPKWTGTNIAGKTLEHVRLNLC